MSEFLTKSLSFRDSAEPDDALTGWFICYVPPSICPHLVGALGGALASAPAGVRPGFALARPKGPKTFHIIARVENKQV